jgi:hypothetical protein
VPPFGESLESGGLFVVVGAFDKNMTSVVVNRFQI